MPDQHALFFICWYSTMEVRLFCKQRVAGSSPAISFRAISAGGGASFFHPRRPLPCNSGKSGLFHADMVERQTRGTQNALTFTAYRFKSCYRHYSQAAAMPSVFV